ncbi:MAG: sodium:alanine symporter family protein [Clostridiales bacterium]|nr:sodium:alanine symporter family protein [Clostridiales bacterium]
MEFIATVNGYINDFVWGVPCIILIMVVGIVMTVRLKFIQFRNWGFLIRQTYVKAFKGEKDESEDGDITSFQAAMVSVSAVVGSGNIAGVATAIVLGGPGALFWTLVAALVGCATKFAEIALGLKYREKMSDGSWAGGPMYYLANGLHQKWLGSLFAILMIFAGFMISAVVDTNTMAAAIQEQFGVNPMISGIVFMILTGIVIFGGITRIGEVCGLLSPFMAGAYLLCGLLVIILNIAKLPTAIVQIITLAFNPRAAGGGLAGASIMMVMRYGFARGIFSNEAGIGTAAITHASAKVNSPGEQALWGPLEVFVDTFVVCTITGLAVVMSGLWDTGIDGAALTMRAFETLLPGTFGSYVVLFAEVLFGFSCLISWYNYVEKAGDFLWGSKAKQILKALWLVFILVGSATTLGLAWDLADTANGLMIIPNTIGILLLGKEIVKIKEEYYDTELEKYKAGKAGR